MKKETKTKKAVKETIPTETSEAYKKYKVTNEFALEGIIIKPNQAIMLTDTQAEQLAGAVELI
jgi:hypothetical protein